MFDGDLLLLHRAQDAWPALPATGGIRPNPKYCSRLHYARTREHLEYYPGLARFCR